jgi:hypothetical protein
MLLVRKFGLHNYLIFNKPGVFYEKHINSIIGYLLGSGLAFHICAQNNQKLYSVELQQAMKNRTNDEKKVSSNLY